MWEQIAKANWFFNFNFPIGFNYVRVKEEDKHKTAFRTRNGYY